MYRFSCEISSSVSGIDPGCEFSTVMWKLPPSAFDFLSFHHSCGLFTPLDFISSAPIFLISVGVRGTVWDLLLVSFPLSSLQPKVMICALLHIKQHYRVFKDCMMADPLFMSN